MATSNKSGNRTQSGDAPLASSALSMIEPMLRPGTPATMELSIGNCSMTLERAESGVRVSVRGSLPIIPQPRSFDDYVALLAAHSDLRPIVVIDTDTRKIVTVLDHGVAISRIYGGEQLQGVQSVVQLIDTLSNQRLPHLSFHLTTSANLQKLVSASEAELSPHDFDGFLDDLEDSIDLPLTDGEPSSPEARMTERYPAPRTGLRQRLLRTLRRQKATAPAVSDAAASLDGADDNVRRADLDTEQSVIRISERSFTSFGDGKRLIRSVILSDKAAKDNADLSNPIYAYALRNSNDFPASFALRLPVFEGTPPITFELSIDAARNPATRATFLNLRLPPTKVLEAAALHNMRENLSVQTDATVIFGRI